MKPNSPLQIFKAMYRYGRIPFRRWSSTGKPTAFVLGLSPWKDFIQDWLPNEAIHRRDKSFTRFEFYLSIVPWVLADRQSKMYVWGYKHPDYVETFCKRFNVPLIRIEDGFIRSVALGATKAPPLSLCFDSSVLYFDPTGRSDLEEIIDTRDFAGDPELVNRARRGIDLLLSTRLSKYNTSEDVDVETIYGPKTRRRVLVVGQVEGDMSIIKGCNLKIDNNDLVRIAARENPDAQIIYKPHPEVLHGTRKDPPQSNPDLVRSFALVLDQDITLADAFKTVDHVYTITSLSGFEALIRGIKVTCLGMPFYAGWGATDDRQLCERRTARRSVEEIFAAAYLLYPKYFDPILRKEISFEEALALLQWMKENRAVAGKASGVTPAVPAGSSRALLRPLLAGASKEKIDTIRQLLDVLDPPRKPKLPLKPKAPPKAKRWPLKASGG
ncbi:beta-3-deoxy-D-manno-oct-2-ulosonic acid transferase [Pararhizobium antarcticum]|uniref:capsular polysaccharide export protein, LipB/KpsS family n=1 Tax=Pararhizobium antarcticum TaxID=1798805 RepID=UPI0008FF8B82